MAPITRGRLLAVSALAFILTAGTASADITKLRLGVLNDMASGFSAWSGPGSVVAAKLAVEDFRKAHPEADFDIEVLSADHQNKADVASAIARDWIRDGVNAIVDVPNSAAALAVAALVKDSDTALLVSGGGHDALTRDACTPNTVHWTFDLYSLARNTAQATVETGGKSWFFVTSDYAGGKGLEAVATKFVLEAGGEVKGHALPPLGLVDYSSFLLQAQSSGADVVAFGTAGTDLMNMIKQSNEFGLVEEGQRLATLAIFINDVHGLGLEAAKGLIYTTAFYWDTNDQTREFSERFAAAHNGAMPSEGQAGVYSAVYHYLESALATGSAQAGTIVADMKSQPIDDPLFGQVTIRPDGRAIHDMYVMQVKTPEESTKPWDYVKVLKTIPGEQAFGPPEPEKCALAG
ncbi:ABC transporter substrate-binding protein [Paracoccus sp. (in: a-proteobacteria)]